MDISQTIGKYTTEYIITPIDTYIKSWLHTPLYIPILPHTQKMYKLRKNVYFKKSLNNFYYPLLHHDTKSTESTQEEEGYILIPKGTIMILKYYGCESVNGLTMTFAHMDQCMELFEVSKLFDKENKYLQIYS